MKFRLSSCFVLLVLVVTSCARPQDSEGNAASRRSSGNEQNIQVMGSDTMVNLGQASAEEYTSMNPNAYTAIGGGGSGVGIAALMNGTADLSNSSRAIKDKEISKANELGFGVEEYIVGWDGLAVVVHPDNPVSELSILQIAEIFTAKITNWKEVGGDDLEIVLLSREVNSGTHVYFKENVVGSLGKGTEFSEEALLMPSSQALADEVTNNTGAIGYYGMGYLSPAQKSINVSLDGVTFAAPTIENVINKTYPIARPLFMYSRDSISAAAKAYIEWILGEEGQAIVAAQDFVPLYN